MIEEKISSPTTSPSTTSVTANTQSNNTTVEQQQQQQQQQQTPQQPQQQQQQKDVPIEEQLIFAHTVTAATQNIVAAAENTLETLRVLNPTNLTNLNYQPVVDAIKPMTEVIKDTVIINPSYLPTVSQTKDSLVDVDLYNGTLLLRSYEVKLKQIRTNSTILSEKADDVDKKFPELVRLCAFQNEGWKRAEFELSKIGEVNQMVENIQLNIDSIISKIESLEIALSLEIDNYIENEFTKWKDRKETELSKYDSMKKLELNKLQEELSTVYQRHEREKILKERQLLQSSANSSVSLASSSSSLNTTNATSGRKLSSSSSTLPIVQNQLNNNNNNNTNNTKTLEQSLNDIVIENPNKEELESFLNDDGNSNKKEEEDDDTKVEKQGEEEEEKQEEKESTTN